MTCRAGRHEIMHGIEEALSMNVLLILKCIIRGHDVDFRNVQSVYMGLFGEQMERPLFVKYWCKRCKRFVEI